MRDIAEALRAPPPSWVPSDATPEARAVADASLAGGKAGLAVLYDYLCRAGLENPDDAPTARFWNAAVDALEAVTMTPSLYEGFTGVAWATAHLEGRLLDADDGDPNEAVDEALREHVSQSPWTGDYDLISGLVGIGVYALERLPRRGAKTLLALVVERLDGSAERGASGITWHTAPELLPPWQREQCPNGYYNLGMAHGVPGVIALLGQACAVRVARARSRALLAGAIPWLLAQRLPADADSSFSSWTGPGIDRGPARSAWCYGDPGIAAAFLGAARGAGESAWESEALAIACRAVDRSLTQSGVRDAGLCHGAAGLAHVFNRMYQATGDPGLAEAAHFWFAETLSMREPQHDRKPWAADPGILTGAAGIALALLAATTPIEPAWDRILLVSIPRSG